MSRRNFWIYWLALAAVAAHFSVAYATSTHSYLDIAAYANATERLPFQYRALTAWLLRALASLPPLRALAVQLPAPFNRLETLGLVLVNFTSVAAATEITRRSLGLFVRGKDLAAPLAFLLPLSLYFSYVALASGFRYSYAYDVPGVALFALGVYAVLRGNLVLLYPAFALACLNRETALFLVPLLLLYRWPGRRSEQLRLGAHALALAAIWLALKLALWRLYGGNPLEGSDAPGGIFVWQAGRNLANLLDPIYWPNLASALGFLWLVVLLGWRHLPPALKRGLWIAPLWLIGMLMVGRVTEVRIFGELGVYVAIAAGVAIDDFLHRRTYRPA